MNTPSACSSRSSAGPPRRSATPRPQTAGPGSSSPPTPSSASPATSPATCACPGNGPPRRQPAHPRPGPPGFPEHPREDHLSSQCAKTRQTRPRAATRIEEPPTGGPPRRGQERQEDLAKGPRKNPSATPGQRSQVKRQAQVGWAASRRTRMSEPDTGANTGAGTDRPPNRAPAAPDAEFAGLSALVTGGASGIGLADRPAARPPGPPRSRSWTARRPIGPRPRQCGRGRHRRRGGAPRGRRGGRRARRSARHR